MQLIQHVTAAYIVLGTLSAPALYDLISAQYLLDAIASGHVPDTLQPIIQLVAPDQAALSGQPMSLAEAAVLLDKIPPDLIGMVREQTLSPEVLTMILLSAHMIIFWLSQDSNVTPPVCLAAFAAATIAGSHPMRTGLMAWKLSKGLYIIPVLFAYTPFLSTDLWTALSIFGVGIIGIYALVGAFQGYLEGPVNSFYRLLLAAAGTALLWPGSHWGVNLIALGILITIFVLTWQKSVPLVAE